MFVVDNLAGIHDAVAALDCEVVGAAFSGEEALEIAPALDFDVAVVDYLLPEMRGVELARHLKALRADASVVLFSALPVEDRAEKSDHIDYYVDKVDLGALNDVFTRIRRRHPS